MAYDYDLFPQMPLPDFGANRAPTLNPNDAYLRRRGVAEASGQARPGGLIPFQGQAAFAQRLASGIGNMLPTMDMQPVQRPYESPILPSQQQFAQRVGNAVAGNFDMAPMAAPPQYPGLPSQSDFAMRMARYLGLVGQPGGDGQPQQQSAPVATQAPQTTDLGGFAYNQAGGVGSPRASNYPTQTQTPQPITTNMPSGRVPFTTAPQMPVAPFMQQPNWDALLAAIPSQTVTQGVGGYAPSPMRSQQITPAGVSGYPGPITMPPLPTPTPPQVLQAPAVAPTAQQNPLFTRPAAPLYQEMDKITARSQATQTELQNLGHDLALQNIEMARKQDVDDRIAKMRFLQQGRSPEGVKMNAGDRTPIVTGQQGKDMGLTLNYSGSIVPEGYTRSNDGRQHRIPAGEPGSTLTPFPEMSREKMQEILTKGDPTKRDERGAPLPATIAAPPMPRAVSTPQRRGGQGINETASEFDNRIKDLRAARASKSPVSLSSGGQQKFGDTYTDQKNFREGREAELAMANARFMPTPTQQSRIDRNTAYIEGVQVKASQLQGKARLDFYNDQLEQVAKTKAALGKGTITDPDGSVLRGLQQAESDLAALISKETGAEATTPLPVGTPPPAKTTAAGDKSGTAESYARSGATPAAATPSNNLPPGTKEKVNPRTGQRILVTPSGEVYDAKTGSRIQ